ncbi:rho guanine nucleotide exchange factor 6 [Nematolebias whitei]|uniref:rho guanine nucleotide exchange factor 6 n=1 Tax=Nematolebias whitei TaxID=451745 RepID=UPI00189A6181|nr:rho guanine nucleotide exchange factor 6 [Nematolebias whitei]
MNPEEQTVTWLISSGVLSSPKKNVADPEEFLKTSLKDGVVLCKLAERFVPGFTPKYCQDPRTEADCISNIKEFLRGCSSLKVEGFEPEWLYTGENFGKVLNTLLAVNFATQDCGAERCSQSGSSPSNQAPSSHTLSSIKSKGSLRRLNSSDSATLCGNLEVILTFQQELCLALEECTKVPESQQRVAACYLNLMNQIKNLYLTYCSSHPSAVSILTDHSDELGKFMESQGASGSGIMTLTVSLSKPFLRLDKYLTLLQELERHVEEAHPDYTDIVKATAAFKSLVTQCQDLRKRKVLELQILSEPVRGWEGDSMKSLGQVLYMSQVHVRSGCNEDKDERYLMLFSNVLVMLSASPRMSGFIYQGRVSLTGTTLTRQVDDSESAQYAFDITGGMIDRITVFCSGPQELQEWLEHLQPFTKAGSPAGSISKIVDGKPLSTVGVPSHLPHLGSISPVGRGPLEPPKISKPWSLSCLRPAPPLKPSAALGYKERMSYIMKDSSKSPRPIKKFLPGNRKKERKASDDEIQIRKSTVALEEDAQILRVIEAYCTGASTHQNTTAVRKECVPQVLLPEEEKIIVEEIKSNGQTVIEEKSLVDAVYALKDEVHELKKVSDISCTKS